MNISEAVGDVLRRARLELGLTLQGASAISNGLFKPSVLGSYERGERAVSLERFCALANMYAVPADRLLADVLGRLEPEGRAEIVIDLTRLDLVEEPSRVVVIAFLEEVKARRGDPGENVLTLRSGDVEALALEGGLRPGRLLSHLAPAIVAAT